MNNPTPGAVIPLRYVASVDSLRAFYVDRLGFDHMMGMVGKDGQLDFAIVQHNGAMLMLSRPADPAAVTKGPLEIHVQTKAVDAYHEELKKRGIRIVREIATQWWGDRNFAIEDPLGHLIWFFQTVAEVSPPPGIKLI